MQIFLPAQKLWKFCTSMHENSLRFLVFFLICQGLPHNGELICVQTDLENLSERKGTEISNLIHCKVFRIFRFHFLKYNHVLHILQELSQVNLLDSHSLPIQQLWKPPQLYPTWPFVPKTQITKVKVKTVGHYFPDFFELRCHWEIDFNNQKSSLNRK